MELVKIKRKKKRQGKREGHMYIYEVLDFWVWQGPGRDGDVSFGFLSLIDERVKI